MKLIIAIIRDVDNEAVCQSLIGANFRVTQVASTGGFLRKGSTTLMIGVEEDRVQEAIGIIRQSTSSPQEANIKRATIFVLNVTQFTQI
ncbi:MAG: cyclic-di-AMP receptor [Anaerolineales bacterium]|nr:cyclic-di-AMP receptor [Anaerolineales bacterium]MCS7247196.1 cyclic-di-AMP receptor [Anaerolineales bacterium]MDW8161007.1 cyclic-di-AMP receptor [Anaerolineales bacterium]MDW8447140.1 cyclic-di-AMP receptor [Anaerolineales bacterium]